MIEDGQIPLTQASIIKFDFYSVAPQKIENFKEAYKEALNKYKGKARESLAVLSVNSKGTIASSNPFVSILINQKNLLPKNGSLLSLSQFGQAFNTNPDFFKGTAQDTGIILRTNGDPIERNNYLAKDLFGKLKHRGFIATPEDPVLISQTDLKIKQNKESEYGLIFDLKEDATPIIAPEYGTKESVASFTFYDERGVPIPSKNRKYNIWKKKSGVSRVYSDFSGNAVSAGIHFSYPSTNSRVVIGFDEIVPENYAKIKEVITQGENRRIKAKKNLEARVIR